MNLGVFQQKSVEFFGCNLSPQLPLPELSPHAQQLLSGSCLSSATACVQLCRKEQMTKGGGVCLRSPSHSEGKMSLWKSSGGSGLFSKLPGRFDQVTVSYGKNTSHPKHFTAFSLGHNIGLFPKLNNTFCIWFLWLCHCQLSWTVVHFHHCVCSMHRHDTGLCWSHRVWAWFLTGSMCAGQLGCIRNAAKNVLF